MAGGQNRLSVLVEVHFVAQFVAVARDNLLFLRIPHKELLVAVVHEVELIEVEFLSRSATSSPEYLLTLASNLPHHVGRVVDVDDENLVVALVGRPQTLVGGEFAEQQFFVYRWYDGLFHGKRIRSIDSF